MTARMLATLALALGLTVYTGCSGDAGTKDTEDTDPGDDDDDDDNNPDTTDTSETGSDYFVPHVITPDAYFGYDLATNSLIDVTTPYGTLTPSIEISIGNVEWDQAGLDASLTDLYCVVQLPLTDSAPAPWAQAAGLYYGVDYTYEPPLTSCLLENGFDVDPGWTYGYGDGALATVFSGPWGVAFGDITPDGQASLNGYGYTYVPEGSFFGAVFNDPILGYTVDSQLAIASEIDANGALTGNVLPATDVSPGNGIVTAFYETLTLYYVTFQ